MNGGATLELSASYGSQVCINTDIPEIVDLRDRLVGGNYTVELIAEKGQRSGSGEIQVVTVPDMHDMNPHVALNKRFRAKIMIDSLQPNKGWWFWSCDECSCKAYEEGPVYRCSREKCVSKSASPRLCIAVVASGDGSSVEVVFFGDLGRDLVGKAADVLVAENCSLFSAVPTEITSLVGRSHVVDVTVSRYSFRATENSFQVLKFYPEGSSVFVGMESLITNAGKLLQPVDSYAGTSALREVLDGREDGDVHSVVTAPEAAANVSTPPPPAAYFNCF